MFNIYYTLVKIFSKRTTKYLYNSIVNINFEIPKIKRMMWFAQNQIFEDVSVSNIYFIANQ